jgi:hypothetical protein
LEILGHLEFVYHDAFWCIHVDSLAVSAGPVWSK